jgi:hypothetical protein
MSGPRTERWPAGLPLPLVKHPHTSGELLRTQLAVIIPIQAVKHGFGVAQWTTWSRAGIRTSIGTGTAGWDRLSAIGTGSFATAVRWAGTTFWSTMRRTARTTLHRRRGSGAELLCRDRFVIILIRFLKHLFDEVRCAVGDFVHRYLAILVLVQPLHKHAGSRRTLSGWFVGNHDATKGEDRRARQHR